MLNRLTLLELTKQISIDLKQYLNVTSLLPCISAVTANINTLSVIVEVTKYFSLIL